MVEHKRSDLDSVFHALSDATRREILQILQSGPRTVGELVQPFRMSLNAVSKHIKSLERAGLITREIIGREHRCHLNSAPLNDAHKWLEGYEQYWSDSLDKLDALVTGTKKNGKRKRQR